MAHYALVVGISQYKSKHLKPLSKAVGDAKAIAEQLKQCKQQTIEPTLLTGAVTTEQLTDALEQFAATAKNQSAIIYFTGHGISVAGALGGAQGYLATTDCSVTKPAGKPITGQDKALSFSELIQWVEAAHFSSLVMMIDTCHSGDFIDYTTYNKGFSAAKEREDYIIMAACHAKREAFAKTSDTHSLFTGAALQAMQPERRDDNDAITSGRLFDDISTTLKGSRQEAFWSGNGRTLKIIQYPPIETARQTASNTLRILFLASDPSDLSRSLVGQELRDIRKKLQSSQYRERFFLDSRDLVRPADLMQAILEFKPQLIHFFGHGSEDGSICLESPEGTVKPVSPTALSALFKCVSTEVKCVILNACYSDNQASAIAKHIPFVIGMKRANGDEAAIAFSSGFYNALGEAHPIDRAYQLSCVEMQLNGIEEHMTPVLYASVTQTSPIVDDEKEIFSTIHKGNRVDELERHKEQLLATIELARRRQLHYQAESIIESDVSASSKIKMKLEQCEREVEGLYDQLHETENSIEDTNRIQRNSSPVDQESVSEEDSVREIIGFDIGHSETAMARTTPYTSAAPQQLDIINGKTSILTAVAYDQNKGTLIGEDAFFHCDSRSLEIFFKSPDFSIPEVSEPLKSYAYECIQVLKRAEKIVADDKTFFYIGTPSGWTVEDKENYKCLLQNAGMKNVNIIPESRAAFLEAKELGSLSEPVSKLITSVLIIDIGSSTTDFTIVKNYEQKPLDFGSNRLGGSLIDSAILNLSLDRCREAEVDFRSIFNDHPSVAARCLLKCRQAKEKYFSKDNPLYWVDNLCSESERVLSQHRFDIDIRKGDMDNILSTPMNALDSLSWIEAFGTALLNCKKRLGGKDPELVLLTGGGSRMKFTCSMCKDTFKGSIVRVGLEPHLTISKGLAIAGRIDLKVKLFRTEIEEVLESQAFETVIEQEFHSLFSAVSKSFYEAYVEITLDCHKKWLEGEFRSLYNMQSNILFKIGRLVEEQSDSLFEKDIVKWIETLIPKLEMLTADICDRYDIPKQSMSISIMPSKVDINGESFSSVVRSAGRLADLTGNTVGIITQLVVFSLLSAATIPLTGGLSPFIADAFARILLLPAIVSGLFARVAVESAVDQKIQEADIPKKTRGMFLSQKKLRVLLEDQRISFEKELAQFIEKEFESSSRRGDVIATFKKNLEERANEACILIR